MGWHVEAWTVVVVGGMGCCRERGTHTGDLRECDDWRCALSTWAQCAQCTLWFWKAGQMCDAVRPGPCTRTIFSRARAQSWWSTGQAGTRRMGEGGSSA